MSCDESAISVSSFLFLFIPRMIDEDY